MTDVYVAVEDLRRDLLEAGYAQWATKLEERIASGATGTEILMGLHHGLVRLCEDEQVSSGLARRANKIVKEIDELLGS